MKNAAPAGSGSKRQRRVAVPAARRRGAVAALRTYINTACSASCHRPTTEMRYFAPNG